VALRTSSRETCTKTPATRDVHDVAHIVQAVAASSSLEKAQKFADQITEGKPHSITSYGGYKELVEDLKVDIIYVATPHSHHYECSLLAYVPEIMCVVRLVVSPVM
jgi:predicted dehydrogenase